MLDPNLHYPYPGKIDNAFELRVAAHQVCLCRDHLREIALFLTSKHKAAIKKAKLIEAHLSELEIHLHDVARKQNEETQAEESLCLELVD